MVPETTFQIKTALMTLNNLFDKFILISEEKQKVILEQNWDELLLVSIEQDNLNKFFDDTMKSYGNKFDLKNLHSNDQEIKKLKTELNEKIIKYKEVENLNFKLLRDAYFLAKIKVEKFFNKKVNDTYTRDLKKTQELWENTPYVLDSII
jgi:hypothetical protein